VEYLTTTQLIREVVLELAQFPGSGAQLYAEDTILSKLRSSYNSVCGELWWPGLMRWSNHDLDGLTGRVTAGTKIAASVHDFADVRAIYVDTSQKPLARMPTNFNPFGLTGTRPLFVEQLHVEDDEPTGPKYMFQVWPQTALGTLRVRARHRNPDVFLDGNVRVPLDRYCLTFAACMLYAATDGNNPAEVTAFQARYTDALTKCRIEVSNMNTELDVASPAGLDEWAEWPT
jgi:hypothetical protein